jgi:uncharacterized membrane protein
LLLTLWVLIGVFLMFRRHEAFWTTTFDQAHIGQIIWNTSQGRWFASSLKPGSYLGDHFSPAVALVAPAFWIFADLRVLLLLKVAILGLSVVPAYLILRQRYPVLAPLLVVAFVLNPAVNAAVVDTSDFQGVYLAAPALALALYAWQRERPLLLLEALALTLLVREDMALYVASFGLYLCLFRPGWRRMGAGIIAVSVVWTGLVIAVLMPAVGQGPYHYLPQAADWDSTWGAMTAGRVPPLTKLAQLFFTPEKISAIWNLLAPMALLPLLVNGAQLLWLPAVFFLLAVPYSSAGALYGHYLVPLFPLWWATSALALAHLPARWAKGGVALLLGAALVGAWQLGLHGAANPFEWRQDAALTRHDGLGALVVAQIAPDARVVAQNGLGPHLATRQQLQMFPWYQKNVRPALIVLDAKSDNIYPYLTTEDLVKDIRALQLDPTVRLAYELDGYSILALDVNPQTPHQGPWQWPPYLELEGYGLTQSDALGAFKPGPFVPAGGRTLRVELYWTARSPMTADYKISVVVRAPDGFILAQDDSWPAQNSLRTQAWAAGRAIRDLHYLALPEGTLPSPLSLSVVVYESNTLKRLAPEDGVTLTTLP